jgi:nucleotide-binding universal stress UspA family protein
MYRRMLVPLDGSKLAEVVLPYATELAGRMDLGLFFLHVCSPHDTDGLYKYQLYIDDVAKKAKLQSKKVQDETSASTANNNVVEALGEVVVGHTAEEILSYVDKKDIDLILMATHGHSGVKRWVIGSNADKVLRASEVPVWLVRAGVPEKIVHDKWHQRIILVPLDGSPAAESVLPHVETLAKQRGSDMMKVVLLRVCEQPFITADYPAASMPLTWTEHVKQMQDHVKEMANQYLIKIQKRLEYSGLKVTSEVFTGKAANEIIDYAHKNPPNLIVMSTHGYSGISRWEYGNVADKVLYGVSSPVFLVRPQ